MALCFARRWAVYYRYGMERDARLWYKCLGYQSHSVVSLEDHQIYERFMTELRLSAEVKSSIDQVGLVFHRRFPTFATEVTMQWPKGSESPRNSKYHNASR